MPVPVNRKKVRCDPDPTRIITRFFIPGEPPMILDIIEKVLNLSHQEICLVLNQVLRNFARRHRNISRIFQQNFTRIKDHLNRVNGELPPNIAARLKNTQKELQKLAKSGKDGSVKTRLLIGSYFTMEYSIESTAFFNPSIVEDPDQGNLYQEKQKRVIISFRATGEGHISSIVFLSGIIDKKNNITIKPKGKLVDVPQKVKRHVYNKKGFLKKIEEMDLYKNARGKDRVAIDKVIREAKSRVMDRLGEKFLYGELRASVLQALEKPDLSFNERRVIESINWLADSHYETEFSLDTALSERIIFPTSYTEVNGIEDARFVRFVDDDGSVRYFATYTAYSAGTILPKLLETDDFYHFKILPLNGQYARNKGMALFPRKINGKYVMLSRHDGTNHYLMYSDTVNLWKNAQKIDYPRAPWEYIKVGNSGSPLETPRGWLVLTHGVGPMRKYCIGAMLLELEHPEKIIGRLKEPLLVPNENEREGYVPNVVYSCGSLLHQGEVVIPYGISDTASTYATVPLDELLDALVSSGG